MLKDLPDEMPGRSFLCIFINEKDRLDRNKAVFTSNGLMS